MCYLPETTTKNLFTSLSHYELISSLYIYAFKCWIDSALQTLVATDQREGKLWLPCHRESEGKPSHYILRYDNPYIIKITSQWSYIIFIKQIKNYSVFVYICAGEKFQILLIYGNNQILFTDDICLGNRCKIAQALTG